MKTNEQNKADHALQRVPVIGGTSFNPMQLLTLKPKPESVNAIKHNPMQLLAPGMKQLNSAPPGAEPAIALQRKVESLALTPEPATATILEVLNDSKFKDIYDMPAEFSKVPRKGSALFDRAKKATAILSTQNSTKRGKQSGDYKDVAALGRWERLAVTHDISRKTVDTGHLIADEFFDDGDKPNAYTAGNLAPQSAVFNEDAYRDLVEVPLQGDLQAGNKVRLTVELQYTDDPLELPVETLVERGALVVKSGKDAEHNLLVSANKKIVVPRRMPTTWKSTIRPLKRRGVTPDLNKVPVGASDPFSISNPQRVDYTPAVSFTYKQIKNSRKRKEHEFQQKHLNEDQKGIKNPAKIGANEESGNYTKRQIKRAKTTITNSKKAKLNAQACVIVEGLTSKGKKEEEGDIILGKISRYLRTVADGTPIRDIIVYINSVFTNSGVPVTDLGDFDKTMDEVYSEDEDSDVGL